MAMLHEGLIGLVAFHVQSFCACQYPCLYVGLPPYVEEALARASELGFASQPSQPTGQQPHKAPRTLLRQVAELPAVAAPPAEDQRRETSASIPAAPVEEPKKRAASRLFQDTQTEYVRIETASKRTTKDLLTDHQKEVAARHRQGMKLRLYSHSLAGRLAFAIAMQAMSSQKL